MTTPIVHPGETTQSPASPILANSFPAAPRSILADETQYLEAELRLTLEEIARLHNALAEANMKLVALQKQTSTEADQQSNMQSAYSELMEEVNPPLVTIANYADLLAAQSVGSLGPLQLRFVERIHRSVEQIRQILHQYHQEIVPAEANTPQELNKVFLSELIQEIIGYKSQEIKKKQLTLQLVIPDDIPEVMGTLEEVAAIIGALISNALDVTPPQEIVSIVVSLENLNHADAVVLAITDRGSGIPSNLIPDLLSLHGDQKIPGCSLTRTQLLALNQQVLDQGGIFTIENEKPAGCTLKISLLPVQK